jgi:hypothetical protein
MRVLAGVVVAPSPESTGKCAYILIRIRPLTAMMNRAGLGLSSMFAQAFGCEGGKI